MNLSKNRSEFEAKKSIFNRMESRAFFLLAFVLCITNTRQQHLQNGADDSSGYSGDDIFEDDEKVTTATEGSGFGDGHLTPCQTEHRRNGRTECTTDGKFKPVQCSRSGKCWCVDGNGAKTSQPQNGVPDCSAKYRDRVFKRTERPVYAELPPEGRTPDDFTLDESSTFRPMYSERSTSAKTSRVQSTAMVAVAEKNAFLAFLLKDPLIFAGIVGGVVLALLCIVLAVMFTIYRMRKKDEGSYALDEPKKTYGFPYTRAEEKEFFA